MRFRGYKYTTTAKQNSTCYASVSEVFEVIPCFVKQPLNEQYACRERDGPGYFQDNDMHLHYVQLTQYLLYVEAHELLLVQSSRARNSILSYKGIGSLQRDLVPKPIPE